MKRRGIVWVGIFLCSLTAVGGGWQRLRGASPPRYVTQPVVRGDVAQMTRATGTVTPEMLSPVGAQVSGILWKIRASWNQPVKAGQVLAELDPALFRSAVEEAEANLQAARAEVKRARAQREDAQLSAVRAQELSRKQYVPLAERDTALTNERTTSASLVGALARVRQARALLVRARLDLANSVIKSPIDGVVIARNVELGQAVVSSFQAPNLFTVAGDLRKMQVETRVDEADIGRVKVGQPASFTVDAYRGRTFVGQVTEVRNEVETVQNVVTYGVIIAVDNRHLLLRPNMTANVRLLCASREDALLIPSAALRFKPPLSAEVKHAAIRPAAAEPDDDEDGENDKEDEEDMGVPARVYVLAGSTPQPVSIRIGISDGNQIEVISGLEEGQQIIVDVVRPPAASTNRRISR